MIRTSRALSSINPAFRIEHKDVYGRDMLDIIWQANGEDEEIAILVGEDDAEELAQLIKETIFYTDAERKVIFDYCPSCGRKCYLENSECSDCRRQY